MEVETNATTSSPSFTTPAGGAVNEGGREGGKEQQPITPMNPTSNIISNSLTPVHANTQAIDEAFVMANYSQLEPLMRKRMRQLRLQGIATRLNYSSEDVDEERELEASPGFRTRPSEGREEPITRNIPLLLAAHLRETERGQGMAEETASEGQPITFMDGGIGEKPPRGKPWKGVGRKNKEKRHSAWETSGKSPPGRRSSLRRHIRALLSKAPKRNQRKKKRCIHNAVRILRRTSKFVRRNHPANNRRLSFAPQKRANRLPDSTVRLPQQHASRKNSNRRARHDTLYHALSSLVPVGNRAESYHIRISGYKEM
ncbi:hypothetical protein Tco_0845226 [Tanacetum coccineum]